MAVGVGPDLHACFEDLHDLTPLERVDQRTIHPPQVLEPSERGGIPVQEPGSQEEGGADAALRQQRERVLMVIGVSVVEGDRHDRPAVECSLPRRQKLTEGDAFAVLAKPRKVVCEQIRRHRPERDRGMDGVVAEHDDPVAGFGGECTTDQPQCALDGFCAPHATPALPSTNVAPAQSKADYRSDPVRWGKQRAVEDNVPPTFFENEIMPILGAEACVLHAPQRSPDESIGGGDIDCAVRHLDPMWPLRMPRPWRLLQCLRYDVTGWYWVLERDGDIVKVDTLDDPRGIGKYGFPTELALEANENEVDAVRASYLTSKRLRKGIWGVREWQHIRSLARSNPGGFRASLERIFGSDTAASLVEAVEKAAPPDPSVRRSARMHAWLRRVRSPERAAVLATRSCGRLLARVMHPTGLTVVLAGPDGTGKSTLAQTLPQWCEGPFRRDLHIHWRPGVLPPLGKILGSAAGDPTDPHGRSPHGRWVSRAALLYYWMDFLLGSWLRVLPTRARSGLVVVERGWWDIAVDPRRYRMQVSPRTVATLGRFLPPPDLVLILEAPVETLCERKGELPAQEARRQMEVLRRIVPRHMSRAYVDASRSIDDVAASARDAVFESLSSRAVRRLGAGWIGLPRRPSPRWVLPRGPRRASIAGPSIYQPVTTRGRVGWELARLAAHLGGFRLMPRAQPPPRAVREALAPHIPARATLSAMRANHPGRYVIAVITEEGRITAIAKVATDDEGRRRLHTEADALARFGPCLASPVRAPNVIAREDGLLLLEASAWRPRARPWVLPVGVARACGELFWRTPSGEGSLGAAHGDLAPWNLLRTDRGWTLVDWEEARDDAPPFFDILHYLVQAHALLGHPSREELIWGLSTAGGWVGAALRAYGIAARVSPSRAVDFLPGYLEATMAALDPLTPDGRRGIAARRSLLGAVAAGRFASPPTTSAL